MYKVIMAPTEGSDIEKAAISVAAKLAQRFDADLRIVRVDSAPAAIETERGRRVSLAAEQPRLDTRLARMRKLDEMGADYRALGNLRIITSFEEGPVGLILRDYSTKFDVDLIVMSSHSRGGLERMVLGSVADYLVRHTHIPVLVVKSPASFLSAVPEETDSRIVVPLDGSAMAEQILPQVAAMALRLNSTVSLLHILVPQTYSQHEIMQPGLPWWDADIAQADAYLASASTSLAEQGLTVTREVVLSDNVATAIMDYSMRTGGDLIAIATSGSGGMGRLMFGSVADEVTRKAPMSILVLNPDRVAETGATGRLVAQVPLGV